MSERKGEMKGRSGKIATQSGSERSFFFNLSNFQNIVI